MQWTDVSQNWAAYIPRIMTRWPDLDEAEVQSIGGDQDAFIDYLQRAKGGDRVAAQMEMADWLIGEEPVDVMMDQTRDNERIIASANDVSPGEDTLSDDAKFGAEHAPDQPMKRAS